MRDLPGTISSINERLLKLSADEATATAHAADSVTIGKHAWSQKDAPTAMADQIDCLPHNVGDTTRVPFGVYRGLRFGMVLHPQFPPDVYLEGAITRLSTLSRDHQGPRAVLNALERLATGYGSECVRVRQDLAIAESQLRDYRERLGKPFAHDTYLSELTSLRDQLKAGLSATAHDASNENGPTVSELADRVKALKVASTIETTPQRVQSKQASAEEPITARIRKRQEANSASAHPVEGDVSPELPALQPPPAAGEDSSAGQPMTFQERIAMERKRQDHEPSLP